MEWIHGIAWRVVLVGWGQESRSEFSHQLTAIVVRTVERSKLSLQWNLKSATHDINTKKKWEKLRSQVTHHLHKSQDQNICRNFYVNSFQSILVNLAFTCLHIPFNITGILWCFPNYSVHWKRGKGEIPSQVAYGPYTMNKEGDQHTTNRITLDVHSPVSSSVRQRQQYIQAYILSYFIHRVT